MKLVSKAKFIGQPSESLLYAVDDDTKKMACQVGFAAHKLCSIMVNQEAMWRKLSGEQVHSLPDPASEDTRHSAGWTMVGISRECRILVDQEAILRKLIVIRPSKLGANWNHQVLATARGYNLP